MLKWVFLPNLMGSMLIVHFLTTLGLSWLWNCFSAGRDWPHIDADTAIVASNVCIGGASTASAMAFSIAQPALVVPASILGVVGYLLGTPLGLAVFKRLHTQVSEC